MKKYICDECLREITHDYPPANFGCYDFTTQGNTNKYEVVPQITKMVGGMWEASDLCIDCARYIVGKV